MIYFPGYDHLFPTTTERHYRKCLGYIFHLIYRFDKHDGTYVHLETHEEYTVFKSIEEFEERRRFKQETVTAKLKTIGKSPVYHDRRTNKYFFPISALSEPIESIRETFEGPSPLLYDRETRHYIHPETLEHYVPFKSPADFEAQVHTRENKRLKKERKLYAKRNPVYKKKKNQDMKFYYPFGALLEPSGKRKVRIYEAPIA